MRTFQDKLNIIRVDEAKGHDGTANDGDGKIENEKEFRSAAKELLKEVHGANFDETKMNKFLDDVIKKYKPDWKQAYGVVQNSVASNESIEITIGAYTAHEMNEWLKQYIDRRAEYSKTMPEEQVSEALTMSAYGTPMDVFIETGAFAEFVEMIPYAESLVAMFDAWRSVNQDTLASRELEQRLRKLKDTVNVVYNLKTRIPEMERLQTAPLEVAMPVDQLQSTRILPLLKMVDEWKELRKRVDATPEDWTKKVTDTQIAALMKTFVYTIDEISDLIYSE